MSRMGISTLWGKIAVLVVVCGWALSAQAKYDGRENAQSTTGPEPPKSVLERDREEAKRLERLSPQQKEQILATQHTISGIPEYFWRHGCGPTAVGMVVGYYDAHGYSDLIPGDASTQTVAVNQAIASGGDSANPYPAGSEQHYEDYSRPEDDPIDGTGNETGPLTDDYITRGRLAHPNNSIADYMRTSQSNHPWGHSYYGWSWFNDVGPSFTGYVNQQNSGYNPNVQSYRWSDATLTWSVLVNEINNNRPMVFLVDTNGDGDTDHFVPVIGYDDGDPHKYACYTTWASMPGIRWFTFQDVGNSWGVWGGCAFSLVPIAAPEINIKQDGTGIPDGTGIYDFGRVNLGRSKPIGFTIENVGIANLELTGSPFVQMSGTNPDEFVVSRQPSTPIAPGSSLIFEITFNPLETGQHNATVSIANNDSDKNPYDFIIMGTCSLPLTIYVDANALNDPGPNNPEISDPSENGTLQHPFDAIQEAIDIAIHGDIIVVLTSRYMGNGNRDIDFKGKAITVRSTNPTDFSVVAATIIDCQGTESEPHRGFNFHSGEDASSVLSGFTIKNGLAPKDLEQSDLWLYGCGGAVLCTESSPTISTCVISQNIASLGGGLYLKDADSNVINCIFNGNNVDGGFGTNPSGGAIYCIGANLTLSNCVITNNMAEGWGAGYGGGIAFEGSSTGTVSNCTIVANWGVLGSGVLCSDGTLVFVNSVLRENAPTDQIWNSSSSTLDVSYSNIEGSWPGFGNIDADPRFIDPNGTDNDPNTWEDNDYSLSPGSPCIDAADGNAAPSTDIIGNVRQDDPGTANSGTGDIGYVDIGAYEFQGITPPEPEIEIADDSDNPRDLAVSLYAPIGVTSNTRIFTVANIGNATLSITDFDVGGADSENFDVVVKDGGGLIVTVNSFDIETGLSYTIEASFTCQVAGTRYAYIAFNTNDMDGGESSIILDLTGYEQIAGTINVDDDAPNDPAPGDPGLSDPCEDGSPAQPFDSIQEAVDSALDGSIVFVFEGIYTGEGNRDISFGGKAITVTSTDPNDACVVTTTVIDCQGTNEDPHRGFNFENGEDTNSILTGFTIINGYATGTSYGSNGYGGAIYCSSSSPTVVSCRVLHNTASGAKGYDVTGMGAIGGNGGHGYGGGIYSYNSSPTIKNCTFSDNAVRGGNGGNNLSGYGYPGDGGFAYGGAIYCKGGDPKLTHCTINNNSISSGSGSPSGTAYGGGVYCVDAEVNIETCTIRENSVVGGDGGGIYWCNVNSAIINCDINDNSALGSGGGICFDNSQPTVTDCAITNNSANGGYGGGIYCNGSSPVINECTISWNLAVGPDTYCDPGGLGYGGGLCCSSASNPIINQCLIESNLAKGGNAGGLYAVCAWYCWWGDHSGGDAKGGAVYAATGASPTLMSCTIRHNFAKGGNGLNLCYGTQQQGGDGGAGIGGAIHCEDGNVRVTNCTISGNSAKGGDGGSGWIGGAEMDWECQGTGGGGIGGAISCENASLVAINCTLIGNSASGGARGPGWDFCGATNGGSYGGGLNFNSGTHEVTNCILWANLPEQIYVSSGSSAVTYSAVQGGVGGQGNINEDPFFVDAATANYRLSPGSPCIDAGNNIAPNVAPTDVDGRPRIIDGDCNDTNVVDMGAYEFAWAYIGDFDGQCDVDFEDYAILSEYWLQNNSLVDIAPPPKGDGIVDELDFVIFSENWLEEK